MISTLSMSSMISGLSLDPAAPAESVTRAGQALTDVVHLAPMMLVAVWALLQLLADAFSGPGRRAFQRRVALLGLGVASIFVVGQMSDASYDAGVDVFSGFLLVDPFSLLLDLTVLAITAATVGFAGDYARSHRFEYGEQESLLLIAAFGVMILNHAGSLLAMFLGIETMSIAVYVMVGARWNSKRSSEAALKYFIMGAFASGLLVMGIALVYGATGTLDLAIVGERVAAMFTGKGSWLELNPHIAALEEGRRLNPDRAIIAFAPVALLLPGVFLVTAALLFKVSAVPFHMWTPDAYDGAPTPTTGFMAAAVKIGGFAAVLKFLVFTLRMPRLVHDPYGWATIVGVLAIVTMTVGNLAAVRQKSVKRLLAYSSVAHVGYLLVGVVAAAVFYVDRAGGTLTEVDQVIWSQGNGDLAVASVLFYLVTYAAGTVGTFACVAFLGARKQEAMGVHEWAGLAKRHPGIALAMTVCLLSLMGMPPMAGFFGKLGIFRVAMTSGDALLRWMVIAGVLNSVVGAAYYLRIIVAMYFRESAEAPAPVLEGSGVRVVAVIAAALCLAGGIGARPLIDACQIAAAGTGYRAGAKRRADGVRAVRERIAARDSESSESADNAPSEDAAAVDDAADQAGSDVGGPVSPPVKPAGDAESAAVDSKNAPPRPNDSEDTKALPALEGPIKPAEG